jgi:hypothetical protein
MSDIFLMIKILKNIFFIKKKRYQLQIYTYRKLINNIRKKNNICHIIATGYSAIDAYKKNLINKDDYIIGLNFAAFLPYKFDIYLCEDVSTLTTYHNERTKFLFALLNKRINNISNLVFKNLYNANPSYMIDLMSNIKYSIVLDKQVRNNFIKNLFSKPHIMMPQYSSTVITATMLAYHAGFENIIIHGLDFSGPHIYHDVNLQKEIEMVAPEPYIPVKEKHITASTQELIWPDIIKIFSEKHVNIFCASVNSNFRNYAKIWKP